LVDRCVGKIEANEKRTGCLIERSLALCAALTPFIGYDAAADIAKEAFSTGKTVHQVSRERKVLPDKELNRALDPMRLTKPGVFSK